MDKIVIVTDPSGENDKLLACLTMLFPECEIQVVPRRVDNFEEVPVPQEPTPKDNRGKNNGKYPNCG